MKTKKKKLKLKPIDSSPIRLTRVGDRIIESHRGFSLREKSFYKDWARKGISIRHLYLFATVQANCRHHWTSYYEWSGKVIPTEKLTSMLQSATVMGFDLRYWRVHPSDLEEVEASEEYYKSYCKQWTSPDKLTYKQWVAKYKESLRHTDPWHETVRRWNKLPQNADIATLIGEKITGKYVPENPTPSPRKKISSPIKGTLGTRGGLEKSGFCEFDFLGKNAIKIRKPKNAKFGVLKKWAIRLSQEVQEKQKRFLTLGGLRDAIQCATKGEWGYNRQTLAIERLHSIFSQDYDYERRKLQAEFDAATKDTQKRLEAELSAKEKKLNPKKKEPKEDRFGYRTGSRAAKINAVLSNKPKTAKRIGKESGATSVSSHLAELRKKKIVIKTEGNKYRLHKKYQSDSH